MSNEVLFFTQIASIIGFIVVIFVLYRTLISQKDATIQLLKGKIDLLEDRLSDAERVRPDILAERYAKRADLLTKELERLSQDQQANEQLVQQKQEQLEETRRTLSKLQGQMDYAQQFLIEHFCPYCRAPRWESLTITNNKIGVTDRAFGYQCGMLWMDGEELRPCPYKTNDRELKN